MHEADARFGGQPTRSMEVIGYDPARGQYTARSYDDQGVSELFDMSLDGRHWHISGKSVRFNGSFDARGRKLTGLWELKGRKVGWQPWIELRLVRA